MTSLTHIHGTNVREAFAKAEKQWSVEGKPRNGRLLQLTIDARRKKCTRVEQRMVLVVKMGKT